MASGVETLELGSRGPVNSTCYGREICKAADDVDVKECEIVPDDFGNRISQCEPTTPA
jgi:hypothetical protein